MSNLSKRKRTRMLGFLEELKAAHRDDASIRALNEIENHIKEKKYGLVWETHEEQSDVLLKENIPVFSEDKERRICKNSSLPYHFIIEGDNLQALYLLEKTHKNKIDCIYIDPPYNTGARDWKYNNDYVDKLDAYRHSKWISFMNVRLRMARNLLKADGVLITTIDDNELANVYLLLKEIFPDRRNVIVTIQMNPGGTQGRAFSVTNEYAVITYADKETPIYRKKHEGGETYNLRRWGSTSNRYEGATCFYPVIVNAEDEIVGFGDVLADDLHPAGQVEEKADGLRYIWPIDVTGTEKKWRYARDTVEGIKKRLFVEKNDARLEVLVRRETEPPKTVWTNPEYNAESFGTKFLKGIIGKGKFSYPKSVYAVKDCLSMAVGEKPDAVVLDFFAGSGTTLNALNLINAEDGGRRKCIMVTNNEVSEEEAKALKEAGYKPGDEEWEARGIAKNVTWPRTKYTIYGRRDDQSLLEGEYFTSMTVEKETARRFTQISYVDPKEMTLFQKKQLVSLIARGTLPQSMVKKDSGYVVPDNKKHTASILIDDTRMEEWFRMLDGKEYITDFYIITKNKARYDAAVKNITDMLGSVKVRERVNRPLSLGFDANVKYLKCAWVPRRPEDYLLSSVLCLHMKEMIELQTAAEVDGVKNMILFNRDDLKRLIGDKERRGQAENIWINQNMIISEEELSLLSEKNIKYIPGEYFGQELREAAE